MISQLAFALESPAVRSVVNVITAPDTDATTRSEPFGVAARGSTRGLCFANVCDQPDCSHLIWIVTFGNAANVNERWSIYDTRTLGDSADAGELSEIVLTANTRNA